MNLFTPLAAAVLSILTLFSSQSSLFAAGYPASEPTADTLRINFSDEQTPAPSGFLRDNGAAYGIRSAYTYGWVAAGTNTPLSLLGLGRNRNPFPDVNPELETLVQMQYGDVNNNSTIADGAWEIALPQGFYRVTVTAGDVAPEGRVGTTHVINVEGSNVIYEPTSYNKVGQFTRSAVVEVTDGRLTIDAIGGFNTKINSVRIAPSDPVPQAYCSLPNPANGATGVSPFSFQITASVNVPAGYELDKATLNGNVHLYEQTVSGLVAVPSNSNDTGGGDAITLTPTSALKPATNYVYVITGLKANRIGNLSDRLDFRSFTSYFKTAAGSDTNPPATLGGVGFVQVSGSALGAGTQDRFSTLTIGPDGKLYASTLSNVIKRWTIQPDGTLTNLEELTVNLKPSPNPVTGTVSTSPRLVIGLAFAPESTASNLIAYVTHSALTLTDGPEWDGVLTRLTGTRLQTAQDVLVHLPRSKKDHLTNSVVFGPNNDLFIVQGSNTAGGEPDIVWGMRLERLLSAAVLRVNRSKLPATLPLSLYTTSDLAVINAAPATGMKMSDGTYNPYSKDSPVTLFATGIRNAYDMLFHSNGWAYIPTNGTAGNNTTSPITPPSNIYVSRDPSGKGVRRPNGTFFTDPAIPGMEGGENQKDWLFKSKGGTYHGHPNPYRGEFVLNHGGKTYSGLPGQLEVSFRDVAKYPDGLAPDPNYQEVAYDFGMNKSPNGVIEYKSSAFGGKLKGMILVARFSGQDDIAVLQPGNQSGDIIQSFLDVPGLQSLDDPLDIIEHPATGNLYVCQYDRGGGANQKLLLMRVADPTRPAPRIAATPSEAVLQATVGVPGATQDTMIVSVSNQGNTDLHINSFRIGGVHANQFTASGPSNITLTPGSRRSYTVIYRPALDNSALGYQEGELVFDSDGNQGAPFVVGLYALKTAKYGSTNEPPLQEIVNTLGYAIEVGWTNLTTNTSPSPMGEEIPVDLFQSNGAGPVTITPVARYSPAEPLPFGWYTKVSGQVRGNELATQTGSLANSQTLYPAVLTGGKSSFTPPSGPFGFYLYSAHFGRHSYSEDALNPSLPHRMRVYPVRDRGSLPVKGSFLIAVEDDANGDYQDYVFLISNVQPFTAETQVLRFATQTQEFPVLTGSPVAPKNNTITASDGQTGIALKLSASEPWVVLPASATSGKSFSIGVNNPGMTAGTYKALVTASAPGYVAAEMTVTATVTVNQAFAINVNFQDNTFSPPSGYVADTGAPYSKQGDFTFGWINPYSRTPEDNSLAARGVERRVYESSTDQDKLMRSFAMLDWGKQNPPVPHDWEIAVPNGFYQVEVAAGDPDFVDSRHTIRAEGLTLINDFNGSLADYFRVGKGYVEVKDGKLTIDDNGATGLGNSKLLYARIQKIDPGPKTGALVRVENMTKIPGTTRSFPADNFFSFNRLLSGGDLKTHDKGVARIHNAGTAALVIRKLYSSSPSDFTLSGPVIPTNGLTIAPGAFVDVTVNFVTNSGEGRRLVTAKLVIESNADNNLTTDVTLRGGYQLMPEGGNEFTAEQVFNAFGFITEMGRSATGYVIDHPSSDFPTAEQVNSGSEGDMVLSKFWLPKDPSKPVNIFHLAALHGPGGAPVATRDVNRNPVGNLRYTHGNLYYQSLLPRETDVSNVIAHAQSTTLTAPFQILIAGYSTAGGSADGTLSDKILGVRAFKAIGLDGKVIPNEYIFIQDYILTGCGPGMANCDWQDNVVYATNIRPTDLPSATTIANFSVLSNTPTDYNVSGSFNRGFPGNRLVYRAEQSNGSALPAWLRLNPLTGIFQMNAPQEAVGQVYTVRLAVTSDNGEILTASFQLTVKQGPIVVNNEPPVAVASINPKTGIEPLLVTLDGSASRDPDGTIARYDWKWSGGSATGVKPNVTFSSGVYSITLTVTDDKGRTATDSKSLIVNTPSNGETKSSFWLEAECAEVGSNWTTAASPSASGSKFVVYTGSNFMNVPPTDVPANRVRFTLNGVEAGYYHIFGLIQAYDNASDSYWVRINGAQWFQWSGGMSKGLEFAWSHLPGDLPFLQNGLNTIEFAFRESGTKLDKLHLNKDGAMPTGTGMPATNCGGTSPTDPTPPSSQPVVSHWLEVECATVGERWTLGNEPTASGGRYGVVTGTSATNAPPADVPANLIRFTIPNAGAGNYTLFARVHAPDVQSDSYWVRVNGGTWYKWSTGILKGTDYIWNQYPGGSVTLREGTNTLDFAFRESGTKLDKVHLNVVGAKPTGMGDPATNCGSSSGTTNVLPVAVATATPSTGTAPLAVTLSAAGSKDTDGTLVRYDWKWNGGSATGATAQTVFPAGNYAVTLTVTDDKGGQGSAVVQVTSNQTASASEAWLEAECATVGSAWITQSATAASNGKSVAYRGSASTSVPPADLAANRIRFTVSNIAAGDYSLYARVHAPDRNSDSYWIRVNGGAWMSWISGILAGPGYTWNGYRGGTIKLTAGTNTIDFAYRESGPELDKIYLTTGPNGPTGMGGAATNCGTLSADRDGDGIANSMDNCPDTFNPDQTLPIFYADLDGDGYGDPNDFVRACQAPMDYVSNKVDNCPSVYSKDLTDTDKDGIGDVCDPDTQVGSVNSLEAECATVGTGWATRSSTTASSGSYVVFTGDRQLVLPTSTVPAQSVTFAVTVPTTGVHHLFLRLNAPDAARNSLWVRVDQGNWIQFWKEIGGAQLSTTNFEWRKVNADGTDLSFSLTAGKHTITVANREAGTELDKVHLSTSSVPPTGTGTAASNCGQAPASLSPTSGVAAKLTQVETERVRVYPNPAVNELNVVLESDYRGTVDVRLYDISGREIGRQELIKAATSLTTRFELGNLPTGVYRIEVIEDRERSVLPFLKVR